MIILARSAVFKRHQGYYQVYQRFFERFQTEGYGRRAFWKAILRVAERILKDLDALAKSQITTIPRHIRLGLGGGKTPDPAHRTMSSVRRPYTYSFRVSGVPRLLKSSQPQTPPPTLSPILTPLMDAMGTISAPVPVRKASPHVRGSTGVMSLYLIPIGAQTILSRPPSGRPLSLIVGYK
jgi:hypothetical protein